MIRRMQSGVALVLVLGCSLASQSARRGEALYHAGRYHDSYDAFQRAFQASGDPGLQYAVGNALYRMRRYLDAAKSYREATSVPRLRQQSYYNLGNSYVRAAEDAPDKERLLDQAVQAYEEALRLDLATPPRNGISSWRCADGVKTANRAALPDEAGPATTAAGTPGVLATREIRKLR